MSSWKECVHSLFCTFCCEAEVSEIYYLQSQASRQEQEFLWSDLSFWDKNKISQSCRLAKDSLVAHPHLFGFRISLSREGTIFRDEIENYFSCSRLARRDRDYHMTILVFRDENEIPFCYSHVSRRDRDFRKSFLVVEREKMKLTLVENSRDREFSLTSDSNTAAGALWCSPFKKVWLLPKDKQLQLTEKRSKIRFSRNQLVKRETERVGKRQCFARTVIALSICPHQQSCQVLKSHSWKIIVKRGNYYFCLLLITDLHIK